MFDGINVLHIPETRILEVPWNIFQAEFQKVSQEGDMLRAVRKSDGKTYKCPPFIPFNYATKDVVYLEEVPLPFVYDPKICTVEDLKFPPGEKAREEVAEPEIQAIDPVNSPFSKLIKEVFEAGALPHVASLDDMGQEDLQSLYELLYDKYGCRIRR